jgi:uncharacterized membrane protein
MKGTEKKYTNRKKEGRRKRKFITNSKLNFQSAFPLIFIVFCVVVVVVGVVVVVVVVVAR